MEQSYLKRYQAVKKIKRILDSNKHLWTKFPAFAAKKKSFDGILALLEKSIRDSGKGNQRVKVKIDISIDFAIIDKLLEEMDELMKAYKQVYPVCFQQKNNIPSPVSENKMGPAARQLAENATQSLQ